MNTLSKYNKEQNSTLNELREEKVKFFLKRILTSMESSSGRTFSSLTLRLTEDPYFGLVYPELNEYIIETNKTTKNENSFFKKLFEFEDFSVFLRLQMDPSDANITGQLRSLLSTAAFESNLKIIIN